MYKSISIIAITVTLFLFDYCGNKNLKDVELTKLSWPDDFGYTKENLFPLYTSPGNKCPQTEISIGGKKVKLLIDFLFNDIIIDEVTVNGHDFEAQRIYTKMFLLKEMMFEEGYLHDIKVFGEYYPLLHILMLKKSDMKLNSHGIIGKRFFIDKFVTLDFRHGVIGIKDNEGLNIKVLQDSGYKIIKFRLDEPGHSELVTALKIKGNIGRKDISLTLSTFFDKSLISPELVSKLTGKTYKNNKFVIDTLTVGGLTLFNEDFMLDDRVVDLSYSSIGLIYICLGCEIFKDKIFTISLSDSLLIIK